jgi:hypothetical protein
MSFNTWTPAELSASAIAVDAAVWRAVEAQHRVSTMKLVDSVAEQQVLEAILEDTKPALPDGAEGLDYLLFTPFRYTQRNPWPSRFRRAHAPDGVFYASASPEAAMAEIAFHRRLFFAESPATPKPTNPMEYTAFAVQIRTGKGLDLTRPPLDRDRSRWTDPENYGACHALADRAREAGIQVICYLSVRDLQHRLNYAVLSPGAFGQNRPFALQTWRMHIRDDGGVLAKCEMPVIGLAFGPHDFDVDSRLRAAGSGPSITF